MFVGVSGYAYFSPIFRSRRLLLPFICFLALGFVVDRGPIAAAYGAAMFALILGIKELVIVDRRSGYGLLAYMISFAVMLVLFDRFVAWSAPYSFAALAGIALLWRALVLADPDRETDRRTWPVAVASLLLLEAGAVIFLLPVSPFYQAALLFFFSVILFEAVSGNGERASLRQLAAWGGTYAAVALLVVILAPWKI